MKKKEHFTFRIDPDLREKLREAARTQERTMGWMIQYYVRRGLGIPTPPANPKTSANGIEAEVRQ